MFNLDRLALSNSGEWLTESFENEALERKPQSRAVRAGTQSTLVSLLPSYLVTAGKYSKPRR